MTDWKLWLKGLAAAIVGGLSGAALDVAQRVVDGGQYDPVSAKRMIISGMVIAVAAYLKHSPLQGLPK